MTAADHAARWARRPYDDDEAIVSTVRIVGLRVEGRLLEFIAPSVFIASLRSRIGLTIRGSAIRPHLVRLVEAGSAFTVEIDFDHQLPIRFDVRPLRVVEIDEHTVTVDVEPLTLVGEVDA